MRGGSGTGWGGGGSLNGGGIEGWIGDGGWQIDSTLGDTRLLGIPFDNHL